MTAVVETVRQRLAHPTRRLAGQPGLPDLPAIWAETRGDPAIRIALLDGPVDRTHPCFRGARLTEQPTLAATSPNNGPASHHGTHIASIIFGQHGSGIEGVAPGCSGIILPVFADGPENALVFCSQIDLARAILQAVDLGAHVINISGGQLTPDGEPDELLAKAIAACAENNVLVVAAAGNDGCDCLHVPAALDHVLPVGAADASGEPLNSSNWGSIYRSHGIIALGENVPAAQPGGGVCAKTGTSFAAPLVSGVAGLLLSMQLKRGETPDPRAVRHALIASATPCDPDQTADCRRVLAGRLDVRGALKLITEGVNMSEVIAYERSEEAALVPSALPDPAMSGAAAGRMEAVVSASEATVAPAGGAASAPPPLAFRVSPAAPAILASDCGCGGACGGGAACSCGSAKSKTDQIVFALGKLGYDFGTEARRDAFVQAVIAAEFDPNIPSKVMEFLTKNPHEAESLIWTLNLDATPIYAIVPAGPFAEVAFQNLRSAYEGQIAGKAELVSVPGVVVGSLALLSGQVVPAVLPFIRGMYAWHTDTILAKTLGTRPKNSGPERDAYDKRAAGLTNFLNRVYYDLRNLGMTPQERALNFSATNAFQAAEVIKTATQGDIELDTIAVRKSPVCRPGSECYDIEIGFFDPRNTNIANKIFRFTVDVSGVMPVTIGQVRAWSKRT